MRMIFVLVLVASGCSARAGMFCQETSDCRTGLICVKPPPRDGGPPPQFGICEPGRRGQGEVCFWSSECQPGLFCSNQAGRFTEDGRHGRCEAAPDLAAPRPADLAMPADLRGPEDLADAAAADSGDGG
jgi:hypothetical protein